MNKKLVKKFRQIKSNIKDAIKKRTAKVCVGPSTIRVFPKKSVSKIKKALLRVDVNRMSRIKNQDSFKTWFESELTTVTKSIPKVITKVIRSKKKNVKSKKKNIELRKARRWGYGAKILNMYLRDIVLHNHYFTDARVVERIKYYLYVPLDSKVINKLKKLDVHLDFSKIKEIDDENKFYNVQDELGVAAKNAGAPRVWFDYIWSE